jgi:L-fuconolactonase
MGVIDAHVHFWDRERLRYPWLDDVAGLQRSFIPADYAAATSGIPIESIVAVEANCEPRDSAREIEFLASLDASPRVGAIVAYVDFTEPRTVRTSLAQLAELPKVRGVRQNIQGHPPGFCKADAFVDGVRKAGANGLTFDICITHDQCREATELVARCPDTTFILDHCGKPAIRDALREPWESDIERLAQHPNVWCKLSGLLTEASSTWSEDQLCPYAARVVACFGVDRLLYGSDWPVVTLAGTYRDWFEFTQAFTGNWTASDRDAFYRGNAGRVYRL